MLDVSLRNEIEIEYCEAAPIRRWPKVLGFAIGLSVPIVVYLVVLQSFSAWSSREAVPSIASPRSPAAIAGTGAADDGAGARSSDGSEHAVPSSPSVAGDGQSRAPSGGPGDVSAKGRPEKSSETHKVSRATK